MTTANLSVGIKTEQARQDLRDLKDFMRSQLSSMALSINEKSLEASIKKAMLGPGGGGFVLKINASKLKTDVSAAMKDAMTGVSLGGISSADMTKLKSDLGLVKQHIITAANEANFGEKITKDLEKNAQKAKEAGKKVGKAFAEGEEEGAKTAKISYRFKEGAGSVSISDKTSYTAAQVKARAEQERADAADKASMLRRIAAMREEFEARKQLQALNDAGYRQQELAKQKADARLQALNETGHRQMQYRQIQQAQSLQALNDAGYRQQELAKQKADARLQALNEAGHRQMQYRQIQQAQSLQALNDAGYRQQELAKQSHLKRMTLLDAKFSASSAKSQLGKATLAASLTSAGLNAADTVGPLAASFGNAAGIAQLTAATKQLGEAHKEATGHTKTHAAAMRDAHSAARGLASGMGMMWLTWGNIAPLLAGASLSHGFIQAMKAGTEFAYQLTFVKALGGETAESVRGIGNAALELSKNGLFGPVELANGLRTLSQAGLSAAESMKALPVVLDLATVGEMNMKDAAVTLVGVMTAFNLDKSDLTKIGDVFAKAAAVSQTSVEQMTQAMKTASVVGEQYGASMQDTATALTLLAKMNITGTAAGTSLRNMLKELYSPTDKAAKIMKDLGVSAQTAAGELKPFPDVIFSMKKKLEEFNKASQVKILQGLFGERGAKEAIAMLSLTREEWDKLNKTISESGGFMREVSAELEGTVKGSFKQAINTLQVSLIEAYNSTEGAAGQLAGKLKETFGSTQFKESLTTIVTGMLGITNALVTMAPALAVAAGGWIALRAAMIGAAVWTSVSTALAGATLATQTLGAVAAGTATTLTGSTGILAAARMLPGVLGAAGASLIATTGLLGPLALAIGAAGAAWYLFRDRTEETMNQSTAKVRTSTQEMISDLRKFQAEAGKLNAGTVRSRADAAFSATEGTWESLAKDRKEAAKRFGLSERDLTGDFNEYALAAKATSTYNIFPVLDAIKKKSAEAAAQREAALGLLKLAKKAEEDDLLIAKSAQVTSGTKNYEVGGGGGGGGRASREAAKLENANVLDLEKRYQAELKTIDAYYAKLEKIESTSAQYGIKTKEEAESKITALTEEHWTKRLEKVSTMSDEMSALLGKSVKLSEADAQKAKTFVATAQEEINTLKEKIEWIKEEARLKAEGAAIKFNKDIDKNNVDLTKELELAKAAVYGKVSNPVERARNNAETLVSNRYAQMIQEAVDARIQAEQSGNEAAIKATAERLELLDQEVQKSKQYYGDQYAALAEYQQTGMYGWEKFWEKYQEEAITAAKVVEGTLNSVTKNIEDAFSEMFTTGTLDFKKMTKAILADMGKLVAKMAVADLGNIITGKGKTSGTILGEIFGGKSAEGGEQGGLSGMLTKAADGLKGFWNSLTGATTATQDSTVKTVESVLTAGTKKVADTSATAAMTELASAAQMAAAQLSTIGAAGGGSSGGGLLGSLGGLAGGGGSVAGAASSIDTGALLADVFVDIMAKGGAYNNGVRAFAKGGTFTNRIVNQPTMFRFADGVGLMGEAGAEAIMPLGRDSQGRLGVRYEGREPPNRKVENKVTNNNVSVSINAPGGDPAKVRRSGAAVAREVVGAIAVSSRYR